MRSRAAITGGRRRVAGLSLVELLLTLGIAAILATIGVPALGRMLDQSRLASATTALAVSLANTRMRAVESASARTLCPSADGLACDASVDWSRGWIVFADADRSGQREDHEPLLDRVDAGTAAHVRIRSTQGRVRLAFQPDGSAGGSNATFEFCAGSARDAAARQIVVSNVGRARLVERPAVTHCNE